MSRTSAQERGKGWRQTLAAGLLLTGMGAAEALPVTLVSNMGTPASTVYRANEAGRFQAFTTGANADGYVMTSVEIELRSIGKTTDFHMELWSSDESVAPEADQDTVDEEYERIEKLTCPVLGVAETATTYKYRCLSRGAKLKAGTTYLIGISADSDADVKIHYLSRNSANTTTGLAGWSIARAQVYEGFAGSAGVVGGEDREAEDVRRLRMEVRGIARTSSNNAPTTIEKLLHILEDTPYSFSRDDFRWSDPDEGDRLESISIRNLYLPEGGKLLNAGTEIEAAANPVGATVSRETLAAGQLIYVPKKDHWTPADPPKIAAYPTTHAGTSLPGLGVSNGMTTGGFLRFEVSASDGKASGEWSALGVFVNPVNDPVIVDKPDETITRTVKLGQAFSYTLPAGTFTDADPTTPSGVDEDEIDLLVDTYDFVDSDNRWELTYTVAAETGHNMPSWLSFSTQTLTASGTPVAWDPTGSTPATPLREYDVKLVVTATDGEYSASKKLTLSVDAEPEGTDGTVTTNEDTPYVFTAADFGITATQGDTTTGFRLKSQPEAGELQLNGARVSSNATVAKTDIDAGKLKFVPAANEHNATRAPDDVYATFDFQALSQRSEASEQNRITINVTSVNDPPTSEDTTVTVDEEDTYGFSSDSVPFADVEGSAMYGWKIAKLPASGEGTLRVNGQPATAGAMVTLLQLEQRKLTYEAPPDQSGEGVGEFEFKVVEESDDGTTLESESAYRMIIDVREDNDGPSLAHPIANLEATAGTAFSFTFPENTFEDADDETLTYTATRKSGDALPAWLAFATATRTFSGTPAEADIGTITVKLTATDSAGASASDVFNITVGEVDTTAPEVAYIARQSPAGSPTNANTLTWRVGFSERVANVDAADFDVAGTTGTLAVAAVSGSLSSFDVAASGGDLAELDATVTLSVAETASIADAAGNALTSRTPTGADESSYIVDNTAPQFASASVDGRTLTITFDEALDESKPPAGSAFTVKVDSASAAVQPGSTAGIDGTRVMVTMQRWIESGPLVKLAYARPGRGTNIRDRAGNELADERAHAFSGDPGLIGSD